MVSLFPEIGPDPARLAPRPRQARPPGPAHAAQPDPRQQYWAPGRRLADGSPAFVRIGRHPVSGRLVGVFADGLEVDAQVWRAKCATMTAEEIHSGERPAPLTAAELEPGTVYYAELVGGPGATLRAKTWAAANWLTHDLGLSFPLSVVWFGRTDAAGYQRAKHARRFADAREPERLLMGLHDEATPERLYLSVDVLGDDSILENTAHEARHAWQSVAWAEANRRGPGARERQEQDARAYAALVTRTWKIVQFTGGRFDLARR